MVLCRKNCRGVAPTVFYVSPGPTWVFDHPLSNPVPVTCLIIVGPRDPAGVPRPELRGRTHWA